MCERASVSVLVDVYFSIQKMRWKPRVCYVYPDFAQHTVVCGLYVEPSREDTITSVIVKENCTKSQHVINSLLREIHVDYLEST